MNTPFNQQKAFITGSSRGIGRAIALELAQNGADILLHYRKQKSEAEGTAQAIRKLGRQAWLYQADLTDTGATETMLNQIASEHSDLHMYVANAASTSFKALVDLSLDNIEKTYALVIKSFLLSVQKLKPLLQKTQGKILTISGIDTIQFCPGHGLLAAAKASLETLTHYLAVELAGDHIRAQCLNPGLVASDSTRFYLGEAFDDICEAASQTAPHGGFATPEKVAQMVRCLLQSDFDWLACKTIYADGGLSFMMPALTQKK